MLRGDALVAFDSKAEFGKFVCEQAGLDPIVGKRQVWNVAGHELTVDLGLDRDRYIYVLYVRSGWPGRPARRSLCLAEVYAISKTGTIRKFRSPELARVKALALLESELVPAPGVKLAALPSDAPEAARLTWQAVHEVLVVRAVTGDDASDPFPFVAPWVTSLNGTTERIIRSGKLWLERHAYMTHVGNAPSKFGRPTKLWAARLDESERRQS